MYASFFGLRELPFNNSPDPRFFFSTPDHEEALASLIYAVSERKGFVLLTGEVGSGKTLVTRLMLKHFADDIAFASITNTHVTGNELLHNICTEFDIDAPPSASSPEVTRRLQDFLVTSFSRNKPVVLMLDEAQALSRDAFEQVRMVGNLEADDAKLLQIVIVGQPELRERFEANDMRQLRQRIFRSFHLPALNRDQTKGYILHRLGVAGAQRVNEIFDDDAIDIIYGYAQGLPRLVNTVCDNAMLSAYAADQHRVTGADMSAVIDQMMTIAQGGPKFASPQVRPVTGESAYATTVTAPRHSEQGAPVARDQDAPAPAAANASATAGAAAPVYVQSRVDATEQAMLMHGAIASARGVIDEIRTCREQMDETVRAAREARREADEATRRLAEQATRVGRLAVTMRDVFARTPDQAPISKRPGASRDSGASAANAPATRTESTSVSTQISTKAKKLDQTIRQNRKLIEDVRQLIAATATATSPQWDGAPGDIGSGESNLTRQVRELADLVGESPHNRH